MQTVESSGWQMAADIFGGPPAAPPLRVRAGSTTVDVYTNSSTFADLIRVRLADLAPPTDHVPDPDEMVTMAVRRRDEGWVDWGIWRDGEPRETSLAEYYVLFHLQWELNHLVLNGEGDTVHAAAVEVDGRAIIFPGSSGSGKTTLAGYLAHRGAPFVADEAVVIDPDTGRARPFPRPLGLHLGGPLDDVIDDRSVYYRRPFELDEALVPVHALGATVTSRSALEIGAVVFPRYDPHSGGAELTEITPSAAFEQLCASSPPVLTGVGAGGPFRRLAELVRRVPSAELTTSDPDRARALLLDWIAARTRR